MKSCRPANLLTVKPQTRQGHYKNELLLKMFTGVLLPFAPHPSSNFLLTIIRAAPPGGGGGGLPHETDGDASSEILKRTPKRDQSGCGSSFSWPLKDTKKLRMEFIFVYFFVCYPKRDHFG